MRSGYGSRRGLLAALSSFALAAVTGRASARTATRQPRHRRVVTGVNSAGKSIVSSDGAVPPAAAWAREGSDGADVWVLDRVPVDLSDMTDPIAGYSRQTWPNPGGAIVRVMTWQPGHTLAMHRSDTLDFLFIISGSVELLLEEGAATLRPGDTVVQRGTSHGWRVVGNESCTLCAVMLDGTSEG